MRSREKLTLILEALRDRIASPSDVIAVTGLPRYEVLASFHILEALGIITVVYARGNYKLYKLTEVGYELLNALSQGLDFVLKVEVSQSSPENIVEAPTAVGTEIAEAST